MISAVLDANTITSGILGFRNPNSVPGAILKLWRKGIFILILSEHIRNEVKTVLNKPYFKKHLTMQEISRIQALLRFQTKQIVITGDVCRITTHLEDDLVLATAIRAKADYLVSGDKPFLQKVGKSYKGVKLVTPNSFLLILERQS